MHQRRPIQVFGRHQLSGGVVALHVALFLSPASLQAQDLPYTLEEVRRIVASEVVPEERIVALLSERCIAFAADAPTLEALATAGASPRVLEAVSAACHILPGEPRWVWVEPDTVALVVGERLSLAARGLSPRREPVPQVAVSWASDDPQVAAVDSRGRVTAAAPGMTRVTAEATNGLRASVRVWVREPVEHRPWNPRVAAALGTLLPGAGQFYTQRPVKGLALLAGTGVSLALALTLSSEETQVVDERCVDGRCDYTLTQVERRPFFWPGIGLAAALWAFGVVDGVRVSSASAVERDARAPRLELFAAPRAAADGAWDVPAVSLRF